MADPRVALDDQSVVRGDPLIWTVTIRQTLADGTTVPKDLTVYGTAWTGMLRGAPDNTTFESWAIDSSNAASGVLVLSLTGAQTTRMPLATYGYDVQVTGGAVSPQTPFKGTVYIVKDYTHA